MLALAPVQHVQYCDSAIPQYSTPSSSSSSSSRPSLSRRPSSPLKPSSSRTASSSSSNSNNSHFNSHRSVEQSTKSAPAVAPHPPPHITTNSSSPTLSTTPATTPSTIDIHDYPAPQLLRLLASLLTQIAAANDTLASPPLPTPHSPPTSPINDSSRPPIWSSLTFASRQALATPASSLTFHARNIPTISLHAYLLRILKYCPASNDVFLALLVYFDRMNRLSEEATGRAFVIDSFNVHRLVIAGVTVASKFFSDVFYTNSRYAKVGGLPQAELNQLELQFLLLNDFRLVIHRDEMQYYAEQLMTFSQTHPPPNDDPTSASPSIPPPQPPAPVQQSQNGSGYNTVSSFSSHGTAGHKTPTLHHQHQQAVMGAIDAYGGRVPGDDALRPSHSHPSSSSSSSYNHHPSPHHRTPTRQPSTSSDGYETDSTMTETEGGETDDEPTIRPSRKISVDSLASEYEDREMGSP